MNTIFNSFIRPLEEILDADENYFLGDELDTTLNEHDKQFKGLRALNKTRWSSHTMMTRSQLQNARTFLQ